MITVHLKKLRQRIEISSDEERAIRDAVAETRKVPADQIVIRAGEELNSSLMLLDGWMARSKDLAERRAAGHASCTSPAISPTFMASR